MRGALKGPVEWILASSAVTSITRRRLRGRSIVLAYHAIVPRAEHARGAGERALYLAQTRFAEQLDVLADIADVVPLAALDDAPSDAAVRRPRVAITFDDAYLGAVTCAIDELESRSMPATIFVAPDCLGAQVFWWDALADAAGEMSEHVRTFALDTLMGKGEEIIRWATTAGLAVHTDLPDYARSATIDDVLAAARRPGVTLGSHSWSHANLARVGAPELTAELLRSRDWLLAHATSRFVPCLAYPYGLESPAARRAAVEAGYDSALCISGGWHQPASVPRFARPRLNVGAGMSLDGFRARLLGSRRT